MAHSLAKSVSRSVLLSKPHTVDEKATWRSKIREMCIHGKITGGDAQRLIRLVNGKRTWRRRPSVRRRRA